MLSNNSGVMNYQKSSEPDTQTEKTLTTVKRLPMFPFFPRIFISITQVEGPEVSLLL